MLRKKQFKTMNLPKSIVAYIDAANVGDAAAASGFFSGSAVVHDENAEYPGREAIRTWVEETTRKYHPRLEVLSSRESESSIRATCRVSGDFPGSPTELDFDFTLADGMISRLHIQ
jgi:hypothetical protein